MKLSNPSKSYRSVLRHQKQFRYTDHDPFPLNPVMDIAIFNVLQKMELRKYDAVRDDFIVDIASYYDIKIVYKEDHHSDNPILNIEKNSMYWLCNVFNALIIIHASFDLEEISTARKQFHELMSNPEFQMTAHEEDEAKSIVYKIFDHCIESHHLYDYNSYHIKFPAFRIRTQEGLVLSYAPSLPLNSLITLICERFNVTIESDHLLVENFCIFYWNLKILKNSSYTDPILQSYIARAIPLFKLDESNTTRETILQEVIKFIETVTSGGFTNEF